MFKKIAAAAILLQFMYSFASAQEGDNANYAPGAVLDFYVLTNADQASQNSGPARRSNATLLDDAPPVFEFTAPMEIEASLEQFKDRDWGIRWQGFVRLDESGLHSLSLRYNRISSAQCGAYFKLNGEELIRIPYDARSQSISNYYAPDLELKAGLYLYELWLACDASYGQDMNLTLMNRGPSDGLPKTMPASAFYYKTN